MTLSARNRLDGKIEELQLGGVMAHVVIRVGENLIESVITRRSAEEMKLKIGDTVSAVIKSTEVMLEKKSPAESRAFRPWLYPAGRRIDSRLLCRWGILYCGNSRWLGSGYIRSSQMVWRRLR